MTADPKIVRRATELAVQHEDCPDCIARAGELCYSQGYRARGRPRPGEDAHGPLRRAGIPAGVRRQDESALTP